ncbi:MAG: prolyl-tRNA synthetase associated domain-containing protein [Proteobacteria bacterium]|nr:prolyl-tRNA synthetase associated domain-containing protein [Pseudomonadota bacterium]MDA1356520.1 prolyl-tRNA synthetase associated domain-containing protein [Pseudomonadota bacterium]
MPLDSEQLFSRFRQLGISFETHSHPAVFTVEEAQLHCGHFPGAHCKNLFLKDKKGQLWLAVMLDGREVNIKALQNAMGAARLSFGRAELLHEVLGVIPGAVTPFGLINDTEQRVRVFLDADMMAAELVNFHPLRNDATTAMAPAGLRRFIAACGHDAHDLEFPLGRETEP